MTSGQWPCANVVTAMRALSKVRVCLIIHSQAGLAHMSACIWNKHEVNFMLKRLARTPAAILDGVIWNAAVGGI